MNDTARIQFLADIEKANAANLAYRTGDAIMGDDDYDNLLLRIQQTAETNGWDDAETLINSISGGAEAGGEVKHNVPMLSLDKVSDLDALDRFATTLKGGWVLEPKLDGIAMSALYENGQFVRAATRGDGLVGEDITDRLSTVHGLPEVIADGLTLEIRGEVFMTEDDFREANRNRLEWAVNTWAEKNPGVRIPTLDSLLKVAESNRVAPEGERKHLHNPSKKIGGTFRPEEHLFANSRNAVAGSLMRKADSVKYVVPMSFAAYDLITDATTSGHASRMLQASQLGFTTAHDLMGSPAGATLAEQVEEFGVIRGSLPFPTDGIVVKADDDADRARLGMGSRAPRWAYAYKYVTLGRPTQVLDVITNIGRTGQLTLRAKLKPVLVDGTVIEYATLNNPAWVAERDIRIGDTVYVRRANDVIPFIDRVDMDHRPADSVAWVAPSHCPSCGGEWNKSSIMWRCSNPSCGSLNSIIFAAGRDYFDWEGLSTSTLTVLHEADVVKSIADVFRLDVATLSNVATGQKNADGSDRMLLGKSEATKIVEAVKKSKERPFHSILAALGIRHLGRSLSRRLIVTYPTIDAILAASAEDLTRVEGIGIEKAEAMHAGLRANASLIKELQDLGVNLGAEPAQDAASKTVNSAWVGKQVVISGSIPGYRRSETQDLLQSLGATPRGSVSKTTDVLIADEEAAGNSKFVKAQQLGVQIMTPAEFLATL